MSSKNFYSPKMNFYEKDDFEYLNYLSNRKSNKC